MAPIVLQVTYKINTVSQIESVASTYDIDIKVFYVWTDEMAIGLEGHIDLQAEGLFDPEIEITNARNLEELSVDTKVIDADIGQIKVSTHYRGTLFIPHMNLGHFPFDCQNLQFCFKARKSKASKLLLQSGQYIPNNCYHFFLFLIEISTYISSGSRLRFKTTCHSRVGCRGALYERLYHRSSGVHCWKVIFGVEYLSFGKEAFCLVH